jgi:ABC-type glycerol-3-phosphate transport system substrate-binding protein
VRKPKTVIAFILSAAAIAGLAYLVLPKGVPALPVTPEESAWARAFLYDNLENPSFLYVDFLDRNASETAAATLTAMPEGGVTELAGGESADYRLTAPAAGLYGFTLDCAVRDRSFVNITLSIAVNGAIPYGEAGHIDIPLRWADETKDFPQDSFGDETVPGIRFLSDMRPVGLYDNTYLTAQPISFRLEAGENIITLKNLSARVLRTGALTASSGALMPYSAYSALRPDAKVVHLPLQTVNGTMYAEKNSTFARLSATNDIGARPSDPVTRMVNVVDIILGAEVVYDITAAEAGLYAVALHAAVQRDDFPSFCSLRIDGNIPFAEAAAFPLQPDRAHGWSNLPFADEDGRPYYIYLDAGAHRLSLRAESEPVIRALRDLRLLIEHVNQFSLNIKKVAGKDADKNRTWRITRVMPETEDILTAYDLLLRGILTDMAAYSPRGPDAAVLSGVTESIALIRGLRRKPDELPLYLENLAGDRVSVLIQCGNALDDLMYGGFTLDEIILYDGEAPLPRPNPPFYRTLSAMARQLWASFVSPKYAVRNDADAINIWINASVMLTDTLQKLADTRFTPATGIPVRFSIMPDQNKLVLASAGHTQPDLAMALEHHIPFELALRGALYDLTQFSDYWQTAGRFAPGATVPYIFNDGVYALPESMDFQALIYREDILTALNIPPPDTWYDVCEIMSELQRFDMSFYMPIASGIGYKWFHQTSPLIYQFDGLFYQPDGLGAAINQPNAVKGITLLGDLFTTYAVSEQVPSFFNAFRHGQTPVGIAGTSDYLLVRYGAPELTGLWKLAPPPGIPQEDGGVSRWYIANGRASVMFEASDKKEACWEFLKWWTGEDIQGEYAFSLLSQYGYVFLPANLNALENAALPDEDKAVIQESLRWLRDVPRSPGQYMLERSLSDIWNTIVFDGTPAQVAIDLQIISIQREFRRKMTEFGYADAQGRPTRPYAVREMDWVLEQLEANP